MPDSGRDGLRTTGTRTNALWGRRGESRENALWGRSSKRHALIVAALVLFVVPLAASANSGGSRNGPSFVSADVLAKAKADPNAKLHVIIQSTGGIKAAEGAFRSADASDPSDPGSVSRRFGFIGSVAVDLKASKIAKLEQIPGLTVTLDAPVRLSGSTTFSSNQSWPYESGNAHLWSQSSANQPTIAIVDSGLDPGRIDFGTRAYPEVNLSSLTPTATGDDRGHGTFVAGIAADSAPGYAGADPQAKILPIRVMDQNGMAMTSDVIAACNWILQNKAAYNIRIANFSLHSSTENHFYDDPLDRAVEQLWFNGVFVVAAAGNYGSATGPSGVWYAPGNDPFVMTVGAADLGNTIGVGNDQAAPFSAYGYTEDGFLKPEIGADGRYMIGPVPVNSTLVAERPGNVTATGYMELSGTSFATPVVAGSAAELLADHPDWTPDQLKGALMLTAKPAPNAAANSIGVGEVNVGKADTLSSPPNPNAALEPYLTSDPVTGGTVFDAASWNATVQANASWAAASWGDASWAAASWSAASWGDASWSDASWADASWADSTVTATATAQEDAAEADNSQPAYALTSTDEQDVSSDPYLAVP